MKTKLQKSQDRLGKIKNKINKLQVKYEKEAFKWTELQAQSWEFAMEYLEAEHWDTLWESILAPHAKNSGCNTEDIICDIPNNKIIQQEIIDLYKELSNDSK